MEAQSTILAKTLATRVSRGLPQRPCAVTSSAPVTPVSGTRGRGSRADSTMKSSEGLLHSACRDQAEPMHRSASSGRCYHAEVRGGGRRSHLSGAIRLFLYPIRTGKPKTGILSDCSRHRLSAPGSAEDYMEPSYLITTCCDWIVPSAARLGLTTT
jgi:hypothetical protein